jgi:hypothetical protein
MLFDFFVIPVPGRFAGAPSSDTCAGPHSQERAA